MADQFELFERPNAQEMYMIAGWRQWADAGSVSSGLPEYLIDLTDARQIGTLRDHGYYLFQVPATHDLVRPVVQFEEGYPRTLQTPRNDLYFSGDADHGLVIFLGDEPHMNVEGYVAALLDVANELGVKRILGVGGVYGELPFDKERLISANYSLRKMKNELNRYAVSLSNYEGGASIGSYVCKRAGDRRMEYTGLYAFVPAYEFSPDPQLGSSVRLENDYMAWNGVLQRANHMLRLGLDLSDLEDKSQHLIEVVNAKIDELEQTNPELGVREYLNHLSEDFTEVVFNPLEDVWEDELRRLLGKYEEDDD